MKVNRRQAKYIRANLCDEIPIDIKGIPKISRHKKEYYSYPVAFDIETSSFYEGDEQRAMMYLWQMCLGDGDFFVYGRTWDEFNGFIRKLRKHFRLSKNRVLVVYIHNLAYECQFIRKLFKWEKVFATDKREPLYMRTIFGMEFRCSYRLSGYSLANLASTLLNHNLEKMVGDLDYGLVRHSETPLTDKELEYGMRDVEIVCAYISERLAMDGDITKIPLTKTGYVRNSCRNACYGTDHRAKKYYEYRKEMDRLVMDADEYTLMRCAFMGGYTHANAWTVGKVIEGVTSQDFTSSYPYVLIAEKYPWSKGEKCNPDIEEVMAKRNMYAWILDIEMYGVESICLYEDYIPYSRCVKVSGYVLNNGRINRADYLHIVITSVDLGIILKNYTCYGGIKIIQAYKYFLKYLPTPFIKEMVDLYAKKTTLKGVSGREDEYLNAKEQLNSMYGMTVTSPIRPTITYEGDEWGEIPTPLEVGISKYNKNPKRFMPYIVGVFVTAYARRNLWTGINAVGDDYIYSDTDSIKMVNFDQHKEYFDNYNKYVVAKLKAACRYHGIPFEQVTPKTIKGVEKTLGVWDFDGYYTRFKTLGAKRYMTETADGKVSLTVSGLNKTKAIPYLLDKYGKEHIFDAFQDDEFGIDNMQIPAGHSGRMVSTYIDDETEGEVTDYMGNIGHYHELSSVHLENSTYTLSLSKDYTAFLLGIRGKAI